MNAAALNAGWLAIVAGGLALYALLGSAGAKLGLFKSNPWKNVANFTAGSPRTFNAWIDYQHEERWANWVETKSAQYDQAKLYEDTFFMTLDYGEWTLNGMREECGL